MEYMNETDPFDQVAWNMGAQYLNQIASYLNQASYHFLNGNLEAAFFRLKVIRQRIIHSLKTDERNKCFEIENNFPQNNANKYSEKDKFSTTRKQQVVLYDKYNTLLMDLMAKYGYLIKKAEDNTRIT